MELIVFSGIQGAGKTTFFHDRFWATHVRLSLDLLHNRKREDILLYACMAAEQSAVIDNTNPTAAQRARYSSIGRAAGFKTALYFFDLPLEAAIRRNLDRPEPFRVPEIGVRGTFAKLQPPTADEPFDRIVWLTPDGAGWESRELKG